MKEYTQEEIEEIKKDIDNLSHYEMVYLHRFAPIGHIYFHIHYPFYEYFRKRLDELGGITPELSKKVGWEK